MTDDLLRKRIREHRLALSPKLIFNDVFDQSYFEAVEEGKIVPSPAFLDYVALECGVGIEDLLENTGWLEDKKYILNPQYFEFAFSNAHAHIQAGNYPSAKSQLMKIPKNQLPTSLLAKYYHMVGETQYRLKEYAKAFESLNTALNLYEQDPATAPVEFVRVYNWLGLIFYDQARHLQALEYHKKCLTFFQKPTFEYKILKMQVYANLAYEYFMLNEYDLAQDYYGVALSVAKDTFEKINLASIYWGMGLLNQAKADAEKTDLIKKGGHLRDAKLCYFKSAELYEQLDKMNYAFEVKSLQLNVMVENGEYEETEKVGKNYLELATILNAYNSLCSLYTNLAYLYYAQGSYEEADIYGLRGIELAYQYNRGSTELGMAILQYAEIKAALGDSDYANALYLEALGILETTESKHYLHKAYYRYAGFLEGGGQLAPAFKYLEKAYLVATDTNRHN
jgi:tetratricopeptide (TPR) repeat protein